jgi:Tfp pilus assembly protein PilX
MTNLFHNARIVKMTGAATLLMTVVSVVLITLVMFFAANYGVLQTRAGSNMNRQAQAFSAADAGMEYGINYLKQNSATVTGSPVGGYISYTNAGLTNVALANSSKFSVTYTNPTQNNYKFLLITATGTSDDGSATNIIKQQVYRGSVLASPPTVPLVSKGALSMSGSTDVTNLTSNTTIQSGSTVSLSGSAITKLASGLSSTSGNLKSDVLQNVSSISSMSQSDFFANYFGVPSNTVKGMVAHYYSNSSDTNYASTLNGMSGTSIWIEQTGGTAKLGGSAVIGTAVNPVLLIVNGNLKMSGSLVINGLIFTTGTASTSVTGSVVLTGGFISSKGTTFSGSTLISYSASVMSALQSNSNLLYYAKVPGSWKDF